MTPIDRYHLPAQAGTAQETPLTSALWVGGRPTGEHVPGCAIEAQYATPLGDLLVTSYDCPFEESNSFVLLDAAARTVARADLAVPYGSFLLNEHWPLDETTLVLHYHERLFYTLAVAPAGRWLVRRPRLRLRRQHRWQADARMAQAHARLQQRLAEIDARTTGGADGRAGRSQAIVAERTARRVAQ